VQRKTRTLIEDFNSLYSKEGKHTMKELCLLSRLGATITAALMLENSFGPVPKVKDIAANAEDHIIEELHDAEQKYLDYIKTQDPTLLNMAKGELRHAAYYMAQAKMSSDEGLRQRLKDYQNWYANIESKLSHNPM